MEEARRRVALLSLRALEAQVDALEAYTGSSTKPDLDKVCALGHSIGTLLAGLGRTGVLLDGGASPEASRSWDAKAIRDLVSKRSTQPPKPPSGEPTRQLEAASIEDEATENRQPPPPPPGKRYLRVRPAPEEFDIFEGPGDRTSDLLVDPGVGGVLHSDIIE